MLLTGPHKIPSFTPSISKFNFYNIKENSIIQKKKSNIIFPKQLFYLSESGSTILASEI